MANSSGLCLLVRFGLDNWVDIGIIKAMNIQTKHRELLDKVNYSKTKQEHRTNELYLRAWRDGVKDAGGKVDLMDGDWYYMEQGIERDMCCGVWLDWEES